MLRFSSRVPKLFGVLLLGMFVWASQALPIQTARAQGTAPYAFTILGPDGAVARVITSDATCPQITIDGNASAMQVRAPADADFPITVCDAAIPLGAKDASVLGQTLKLPNPKPARVAVIGDTGCRIKGDTVQSCNDVSQWPFATVAATVVKSNPDLVIHVGDYHYRESPCIVDKADCAGSPYGNNWASWDADFFAPARALLPAAPWVFVVGNHEDCSRAGVGFFRLLDPRPMFAACPVFTDPYALNYMDPQMIVVDDSAVNDFKVEPDQLAAFQKQSQQINQMAKGTTWLLIHDPFYVFGHLGEKDGKETMFQDQLTLQQAFNNTFPASVQLLVGGHIHLFQVLSFGQGRPPQLVTGNGGTLLDKSITTPLTGLEIGGMKVAYGTMIAQFGFVLMDRSADNKWALGIKNVNGGDLDKCVLGDGSLLCGQAALPVGGYDVPYAWFIALALLGGAVVLFGFALGVRGAQKRNAAR